MTNNKINISEHETLLKISSNEMDFGPYPYCVNMKNKALLNDFFKTPIWTGKNLHISLLCLDVNKDLGIKIKPTRDQFIYIESGQGIVQMGDHAHDLDYSCNVSIDDAVVFPAGIWHNLINTGVGPLKAFIVTAPSIANDNSNKKKPLFKLAKSVEEITFDELNDELNDDETNNN